MLSQFYELFRRSAGHGMAVVVALACLTWLAIDKIENDFPAFLVGIMAVLIVLKYLFARQDDSGTNKDKSGDNV